VYDVKRGYIILALSVLFVCQSFLPTQSFAFETRRVVLVGPVDTARFHSQEISKIIEDSWKRVFRYPFYEVTAEVHSIEKPVDKAAFEKLIRDHHADIVVATEIVRLHDITYNRGFWDDETWQDIDLLLTVKTYARANEQVQVFSVSRWQSEPLSINSGAAPLVSDAMDEVLARTPFKRVPQDI
jgi:hypothetical protein